MMFDSYLRELKDRLFKPISNIMSAFSPNTISIVGFLVGIFCVYFLYLGNFNIALFLWILNRFLDGMDGAVARISGKESDLGGYIDIILDFIIYAGVPLALVLNSGREDLLVLLSVLLSVYYVNAASWMYLSAIIEKRRLIESITTVNMPSAIIGGAETLIFYTLFILMNQYLYELFTIMILLVSVSIAQRMFWAVKKL